MITGNEGNTLLRCLDSARDAFDELCIVRAIGDSEPDNTLQLAGAWCESHGKQCRSAVYGNTYSFPHVDDFSAARNLAFSLATNDWQMWLDADDYLDEINCKRIREAVAVVGAEVSAIRAQYLVENDGGIILRERLIRTGKGKWRNPVHEVCEVSGSVVDCQQIQVFHTKHTTEKRSTSNERNAAILAKMTDGIARTVFYAGHTAKEQGRFEDASKHIRAALILLESSQVEERYVCHIDLADIDTENRTQHLLDALRIQPHRREALATLCQDALHDGRMSDAVSWFRMMDSLPVPSPIPWTHQGIWYGAGRDLIRFQLLKACGQVEQAEKEHAENMQRQDYAAAFERFFKS